MKCPYWIMWLEAELPSLLGPASCPQWASASSTCRILPWQVFSICEDFNSTRSIWKNRGRNHCGLHKALALSVSKLWIAKPWLENKSNCWTPTKPLYHFQLAAEIHQSLIKQMPPLQKNMKDWGKKKIKVCVFLRNQLKKDKKKYGKIAVENLETLQ